MEKFKNEDFGEKGQIMRLFFKPSTLKNDFFNLRVGYVYMEKSFDTIFNKGGGVQQPSPLPPIGYGSVKSTIGSRVNT